MVDNYYIKSHIQKATALYEVLKLFKYEELGGQVEEKLEEILKELVDLITDEENEEQMDKYLIHLYYNGIYGYEDGVGDFYDDTSIVDEIIETARRRI